MPVFPSLLRRFLSDRRGAVTTDWVVLTGAITGIGISIAAAVTLGATSLGVKVENALVTEGGAFLAGDVAGGLGSNEAQGTGDAGGETGAPAESGPAPFEPMDIRSLSEADVAKFTADFGDDSDKRLNNRLNNILTKAEAGKNVDRRVDLAGIAIAEAESRGLDTADHRARYDAFR